MTTIADTDEQAPSAVDTGEIVFRARGTAFKAVIRPSHRRLTEHGSEFVPGEYADFAPNAMYRTGEQRIIDHLRGLPSFNVEFFEVGKEPGREADPQMVLEAISQATIELDDDRLAVLEAEERAGENRGTVVQAVAAARQQVQRIASETAGR